MSWFRRISITALILCLCVVVFGAYVRLSDAGLGCPDWPGCYGHIGVPAAEHDVSRAEARFPERPVEAHKAWKEMIHRYLASTLGLLIVAMAFLSLRRRTNDGEPSPPRVLSWTLVALVIFQGILGMWTVTWQLKPLVVTAHLLGGMATFSLLLWQWWSVRPVAAVAASPVRHREHRSERQLAVANEREQRVAAAATIVAPRRLRLYAGIALVLLIGQIFLGGWTSTNYAALACPDLPTCHGSFWPETDIPTAFTLWHGLGINYEYGILDARARVTIHHFHRVGAVIIAIALLGLGIWLLRKERAQLWRRLGTAVLAALSLQLLIGISIVKLQLPLLLAAGHNAGAAILLAVLVSLNYHAWAAARRQES